MIIGTYNFERQWLRPLTLILLAFTLLRCSSHAEDEGMGESVPQSEAQTSDQGFCQSGIGIMLNLQTAAPEFLEVRWETSNYGIQSVYSDCQEIDVTGVTVNKRESAIYLEDYRYEKTVAEYFSVLLYQCDTGQLLWQMPVRQIQKRFDDVCRFYLQTYQVDLSK